MSDPIKAALEAAARVLCFGPSGEYCDACVDPVHCSRSPMFQAEAALIVEAFHKDLARSYQAMADGTNWHDMDASEHERIARLIKEAACDE